MHERLSSFSCGWGQVNRLVAAMAETPLAFSLLFTCSKWSSDFLLAHLFVLRPFAEHAAHDQLPVHVGALVQVTCSWLIDSLTPHVWHVAVYGVNLQFGYSLRVLLRLDKHAIRSACASTSSSPWLLATCQTLTA